MVNKKRRKEMINGILDKLDKKVRDMVLGMFTEFGCKKCVEKDNVMVGVHGKLRNARLCVNCDTVFFEGNECPSCSGKQILLILSKWLGGEVGEGVSRKSCYKSE
jgi:hypothetical protein